MATVYTFTPRSAARKRARISVNFFQWTALIVLFLVAVLVAVGGYLIFREYQAVRRVSLEISHLEKETARLKQEYARLTAPDLVLARAKKLGLHPARPEQVVRLP